MSQGGWGEGKRRAGHGGQGKERIATFTGIPKTSENKSRDLYFSKALFEGLIFGGAYIRRDLSTEGNFRFKIDWASLIVGGKFTVFALCYFVHVFEGNFKVQAPGGGLIFGGAIERFSAWTFWGGLNMEGVIFGILRYSAVIVMRFNV